MSEKQFVRYWYTGLGVTVAIVAAVATLLLAIIGTARGILANAERALALANEIVDNTRPIWHLEQTNAVAADLLNGARLIETHATEVADALETPQTATSGADTDASRP